MKRDWCCISLYWEVFPLSCPTHIGFGIYFIYFIANNSYSLYTFTFWGHIREILCIILIILKAMQINVSLSFVIYRVFFNITKPHKYNIMSSLTLQSSTHIFITLMKLLKSIYHMLHIQKQHISVILKMWI